MRAVLVGFAAIGLTPFVTAQAPSSAAAATKPDFSKEGVIVEQLTTQATFENDGTGTRTFRVRARVQSDAGVQKLGLLTFAYQASVETLDITYVRVRKADGSVVATSPDTFQDMPSDITRVAPLYSDSHEKHVAVKGLSAGDMLEYECQYKLTKPLAPGQFWFDYNFDDDEIVLDEQLEIKVPRQRAVKFKSLTVRPTVTEALNYRIYTWKTANLKSKQESDEDKTQKLIERMRGLGPQPDVRFSSFQTWEEIGRWYSDLQKDRISPTPEIAAKAAELTKGAADDSAKLQAIYRYVSLNFRYIGVDFGIGRYQPHSAAEVLGNQYGDCKDKHTLLAALLAAVGIKAYPALIDVVHEIDVDVPSPSQFDHVISVVPKGQDMVWLDTTAETAPVGFLYSVLLNKHALVMTDDAPAKLVVTPKRLQTTGFTSFHIEAKLDTEGTLNGHIERENRGDDKEVVLRGAFRRVPLAQWKDLVQQFSYQSGFAGDVSDVAASQPEATDRPLHFSYQYKRKDYPDWANHRVSPPLPPILLPAGKDREKNSTAPIWLGLPQEIDFQSTVELPPGYSPELPAAIDMVRDYAEFHSTSTYAGGKITTQRHLFIRMEEVPAKEEADYKAFQKAVADDHDSYIVLSSAGAVIAVKTGEPAFNPFLGREMQSLPGSADPEAERLEGEARDKMQGGVPPQIAAAIPLLEKAVEADPTFSRAWVMLGTLYMLDRRPDDGLDALQKAIDAQPKQAALYKLLGSALMSQKKYEDAVDVWKDMVENLPQDSDGPAGLGTTLVQLHRYPEAIAAMESGLKLDPEKVPLLFGLAYAYAKAGMADKSMDMFHKVIALQPGPGTSNNIAYSLADANLQLPQALELAVKAVADEEEITRKMTLGTLKDEDLKQMEALGMFWDTLGWVHFRMGNLAKAESYLKAAWILSQHAASAEHLGELYEQQQKKAPALEMYQAALGSITLQSGVDTRAVLDRMSKLNIAHQKIQVPRLSGDADLSAVRTTPLPRLVQGQASAEFFILLSPGPKVDDVKFVSGSDKLKTAVKTLSTAKINVPFPEGSDARVVRRGILSCYPMSGCTFVLYTLDQVKAVN